MAAGKKAPASSKTAHVMNLLSSKSASSSASSAAPAPSAPPAEAAQAAAVPPAAAGKAPVIVSLSSEAAVSEQIREALVDALDDSAPAAAEQAEQAAADPAPADQAQEPPAPPVQPEVSAPAAQEAVPAAQPPVERIPAPSLSEDTKPQLTCVNIMQVLVEENADKYIKMFGLCQCPHCKADVKALALNDLPPKYVVMESGHVVPRISVYEGRYQTAVTAQILRACKTVMDQPRHGLTFQV
jgi:hypothetical protein